MTGLKKTEFISNCGRKIYCLIYHSRTSGSRYGERVVPNSCILSGLMLTTTIFPNCFAEGLILPATQLDMSRRFR